MKLIFIMLLSAAMLLLNSCVSDNSEKDDNIEPIKSEQINVPEVVLNTFNSSFSTITNVVWEMESATEYEANFQMENKEYSAKFNQSGKLLETESAIDISELPEAVNLALADNFPDFKIEEAEKADTFDKGIVYEVEVEKEETYIVLLSENGTILKQELENEEKDNGDEVKNEGD